MMKSQIRFMTVTTALLCFVAHCCSRQPFAEPPEGSTLYTVGAVQIYVYPQEKVLGGSIKVRQGIQVANRNFGSIYYNDLKSLFELCNFLISKQANIVDVIDMFFKIYLNNLHGQMRRQEDFKKVLVSFDCSQYSVISSHSALRHEIEYLYHSRLENRIKVNIERVIIDFENNELEPLSRKQFIIDEDGSIIQENSDEFKKIMRETLINIDKIK